MYIYRLNWIGINVSCLHVLAAVVIRQRLVITECYLNNNVDKNLSFVEEISWSTPMLKPWSFRISLKR